MTIKNAREQIRTAVLGWEGVSAHPHRFGGQEYRLGRRELGHLHGNHLLDVPLPTRIRDEVVAAGRARPHHILPDSGWVSFPIQGPDDIQEAIALLRLSYEVALKQKTKRKGASPTAEF